MLAEAEPRAASATAVSNAPALRIEGLGKRYGALPVLDGLDLEVAPGAAFGLIGVNGAGKTTLIKCVLDLCASDAGRIEIFGASNRLPAARLRLGYVPERFLPPHYLRCREFLELALALAGERFARGAAQALLAELELDPDVLERPVRQLSKGMTQKLGLAVCFLVPRDLYVLDEPMSDLDPASRVAVKSVLVRLVAGGRTLFFTSHVLADVEELCSSIAVLDRGAIRFLGTPGELCERYGELRLERAFIRCIKGHGEQPATHG
ncbi:MAG: ABC transporter ATP-binding protein [Betaproteobacteria bacterium]|nr:ABC transporter ATP-binding protein [Betaproteobacteria bacterium]